MEYYIYNAIQTPDGTILWCQNGHYYKEYTDTISKEKYMNDGVGYSIKRSVNKIPYKELSIATTDDFNIVRTAKFWKSYGKSGTEPGVMLSLEEMETEHIEAILATQKQIYGTPLKDLFQKEIEFRIKNSVQNNIINKNKKPKV